MRIGHSLRETFEDDDEPAPPPPAPPRWLEPGAFLVVSDTYNDRLVFVSRQGDRLRFQSLRHGLSEPSGLAVDGEGRLLVTDTENHRLVRMRDPGGRGWESLRLDPGWLSQPSALAVEPRTGRIFVSDPNSDRILRLDDFSGRTRRVYSDGGRRFRMPEGLAFDPAGRLFAATTDGDYAVFRIDDLEDTRGRSWASYQGEDLAPLPGFRDLSNLAIGADGLLFATDPTNDRVVAIRPDLSGGRPMGTFGQAGRHLFTPLGLAAAPGGDLIVVDSGNSRIVSFDPRRSTSRHLAGFWTMGGPGTGDGQLLAPTCAVLWRPRP